MSESGYQGVGEHQHQQHQHQLVLGGNGGGGGSQLLPFYLHVPQHSRREKLRYPPCTDVNDHGSDDPPQPGPPHHGSYNSHGAYVVSPPPLFMSGGSGVHPPHLLPPPTSYLDDHHNSNNPNYSTAADVAAPSTTNPQFATDIHNHFHQYPYYPFFPHQPVSLSLSSSHSSAFHHPSSAAAAAVGASAPAPLASRCPPSAPSPPAQPFTGYAAVLKGSRFLRPAQQMLQEICDVGALGRGVALQSSGGGAAALGEPEPLSPGMAVDAGPSDGGVDGHIGGGERRRIKTRLVSMLDEVCRRYRQYYQQILAVVSSFESVAGLGNAAPYTSIALSAMTKHFRCLRNAISEQLRFAEKAFGKEASKGDFHGFGNASIGGGGGGGIFFHGGPAPHSSAHNIGQPSVWRPQRGLPERAVAVLKAWLFEHFLHPYPTDTDKHMLAKQTGLTRNQVSNWFINARVRLWKPLVEEIHSLEVRQAQKGSSKPDNTPANNNNNNNDDGQLQSHVATTSCTDQSSADHQSGSNRTNENAVTHHGKNQDHHPPKRFRNDQVADAAAAPNHHPSSIDDPIQHQQYSAFGTDFPGHHQQQHLGLGTTSGGMGIPCTSNGGVSLTLGLHQNDGGGGGGMCLPEPLPYNVARRFGLEEGSTDGYGMGGGGGFDVQDHRHFGKGIDGHLLHDFVG